MAGSIGGRDSKPLKFWVNPTLIWLLCSLAIALLYRIPALVDAFSADYVVQDDARQHVFWMQRFVDANSFPNDFIADYFQSVAPWGYTNLYRLGASLGIDVWTLNKLLPVAIALVATVFVFFTVMAMVQLPVAAFVAAMFLNQTFPLRDDVVSATPAAFFHPFFLAFLYFTLRRSWLPCALAIALMGLFYPQGVLVMAGTLALRGLTQFQWKSGKPYWQGDRADLSLLASGFVAAFVVLLPYALRDSAYGPVLTFEQAQTMFALSPQGWSKFFDNDPLDFWLFGKRTGLFPFEWSTLDLKVQPQIWLTLAIPFLLYFPGRSRLAVTARPRIALLLQVAIASVVCYVLAHWLLFELHLPNRYTEHSFRALVALGSGVAVALVIERIRPSRSFQSRKRALLTLLGVWAIAPLLISSLAGESSGNYLHGRYPELYQYLQSQPQTTVVASLDEEINTIPSFAERTIFVGGEGFTLPYHLGYYDEIKQRSIDLIEAQYTSDAVTLKAFLDENAIDFWLVSPEMFTPEWIQSSRWLLQYAQETDAPQRFLVLNQSSIVENLIDQCGTASFDKFSLLDTACLQRNL